MEYKIKTLIIEDEKHTANGLKKMLSQINNQIEVLEILESVEDSIDFLSNQPEPDLIFMDIQLSDGLSFEIFKDCKIEAPIIFTTSFDEYAIKAFEVNSVDYLLKPIEKKALEKSLKKLEKLNQSTTIKVNNLLQKYDIADSNYKTRFLMKTVQGYKSIHINDIAYFYIKDQLVSCKTFDNERYSSDKSLDELEKRLNPTAFFRVNRQFLVNIDAISEIHNFFNSGLKLELNPQTKQDVIVSRYTVKKFKLWLDE